VGFAAVGKGQHGRDAYGERVRVDRLGELLSPALLTSATVKSLLIVIGCSPLDFEYDPASLFTVSRQLVQEGPPTRHTGRQESRLPSDGLLLGRATGIERAVRSRHGVTGRTADPFGNEVANGVFVRIHLPA
jgi:hypothetical protein